MLKDPKGPLPRMHVLRVFEAAARHSNFTRAAEELGVHQPAVSRYIAELEHEIGIQLFERNHRSVNLTPAGEIYHCRVAVGLEHIATSARMAMSCADEQCVTIACSHAFTHQFLVPHYSVLNEALGENICLSIMTIDYSIIERVGEKNADLTVTYDKDSATMENRVRLFRDAITPVCSPGFAAAHAEVLSRPATEWGELPFLRCPNEYDMAAWNEWFELNGHPSTRPRFIYIGDYVCLTEAAVDGQGLALGWQHYVDQHLSDGKLVALGNGFIERSQSCFATLTKRGRQRLTARRCLDLLGTLYNDSSPGLDLAFSAAHVSPVAAAK